MADLGSGKEARVPHWVGSADKDNKEGDQNEGEQSEKKAIGELDEEVRPVDPESIHESSPFQTGLRGAAEATPRRLTASS